MRRWKVGNWRLNEGLQRTHAYQDAFRKAIHNGGATINEKPDFIPSDEPNA